MSVITAETQPDLTGSFMICVSCRAAWPVGSFYWTPDYQTEAGPVCRTCKSGHTHVCPWGARWTGDGKS